MRYQTITVIGANGNMGHKVAGVFASLGGARVYMVSRSLEASRKAIESAAQSVRDESVAQRMIPADYSVLQECLSQSDLVFESVAEDLELKKSCLRQIIPYLNDRCLICTGTSGLSVTELAEELPETMRGRYFGIHFFNPPYQLVLCEVIATVYSDRICCASLQTWLREKLLRRVVEVKDSAAFLCNRIGLYCINEAVRGAEKYAARGGIDYVDSVLGSYTGRNMPPLVTADFIGLDVHKAVCDYIRGNISDYASDSFRLPEYMTKLIGDGRLGRKSGGGLYSSRRDDAGRKTRMVYSVADGSYRPVEGYELPHVRKMNELIRDGRYFEAYHVLRQDDSEHGAFCTEFLLKYVLYSLYCVDVMENTPADADIVMAEGFNWCPPQAMLELLGGKEQFISLVRERLPATLMEQVDLEKVLATVQPSSYDFRRFIRAQM